MAQNNVEGNMNINENNNDFETENVAHQQIMAENQQQVNNSMNRMRRMLSHRTKMVTSGNLRQAASVQ